MPVEIKSCLILLFFMAAVLCQVPGVPNGPFSEKSLPTYVWPNSHQLGEPDSLIHWVTETYHLNPPEDGGGLAEQATLISVNSDPEADFPIDVLVSPDGDEVVVLHRDTANLVFFDPKYAQPQHVVAVASFPVDMSITSDGQYLLVVHVFDQNISVVDRFAHQVHQVIDVSGWQPFSVRVSQDASIAVVAAVGDPEPVFCVIDLQQMNEIRVIPCTPHGAIGGSSAVTDKFAYIYSRFALTPDGRTILQPDQSGSSLRMYDVSTGEEIGMVPVTGAPFDIDVLANGRYVAMSPRSQGNLTMINLVTKQVLWEQPMNNGLFSPVKATLDGNTILLAVGNHLHFFESGTGFLYQSLNIAGVRQIVLTEDGKHAILPSVHTRVIDLDSGSIQQILEGTYSRIGASSGGLAVTTGNLLSEKLVFYDIGPQPEITAEVPSGVPSEGDAPIEIALAPAENRAVISLHNSSNMNIVSMDSGESEGYIEGLGHPWTLGLTSDGSMAAIGDKEGQVHIVDMEYQQVARSFPGFDLPGQISMSADSRFAYVLDLGGQDKISFIEIDGRNSQIVAQTPAGEPGFLASYPSQMLLSPNGDLLAVCDTFNDMIRIFDTKTYAELHATPVDDFPFRLAFSPDSSRVYSANYFPSTISKIDLEHSPPMVISRPSIERPFAVFVDPNDQFVYVINRHYPSAFQALRADDLSQVALIPLGDGIIEYVLYEPPIFFASFSNRRIRRIYAEGENSTAVDETVLEAKVSGMDYDSGSKKLWATQSRLDRIAVIDIGLEDCPGDLNFDGIVDLEDIAIRTPVWNRADGTSPPALSSILELIDMVNRMGPCPKPEGR